MENKNIVIATGSFGGPATYSKLLKEKLPLQGIEVEIISFGEVLQYPKIIRHLVYFLKLIKALKKADLIYAQDPVSVGLPAYFAAKYAGKPFYLKVVGDYAWEQGQVRYGVTDPLDIFVTKKSSYALSVRILRKFESFVARRAKKIIAPSAYLKRIVTTWGVVESKIEVIYNGIKPTEIKEDKEVLRKKFDYTYPTFVSAGRLVPWKEFPTLLHAFSEVVKECKEAKLFIIDDGPEKEKLLNLSRELGIEKHVFFVGKVPQAELHLRIKGADCFVLASSYEGFSHVLLEAMALGIPIITSRSGGNPELFVDGMNGLLVSAGDFEELKKATLLIAHDKDKASQFAKNGLERLKDFSEEVMIKKLVALLK